MRFAALFLLAAAAGLSQTHTPSIQRGGVVPLNSASTTIQPGEWISIFGSSLAGETALWNGNFPPSLGGTSVLINGKPAYIWFVSPGQINVQAPDDTAAGTVPVIVTNASGTAVSSVNLAPFAPSFSLLDSRHVTGIILRGDGSGAYGDGTYDVLGPTGVSLGYLTTAARPGDQVEIFGVGFGPTVPAVPAGKVFTGVAPTTNAVKLQVGNVSVTPSFSGITAAGLYQINFTMPANAGSASGGDVPLVASVGGVGTPPGVVISLQPTAPDTQPVILTLSTNTITGSGSLTGIILIPGIAPAGGAVVELTSSSPDASVPPSMTVPAGSFAATFPVTVGSVSANENITITAAYAGGTSTASLAANPAPPSFTALTLTGTWTLPGYPRISLQWTLQPDTGASTFTASGGILFPTLTGCVANGSSLVFDCETVAASPQNYLVTTVGIFLSVATGSLKFAATPNAPSSNTGSFSGTLQVSDGTQSFSGPITGGYFLQP